MSNHVNSDAHHGGANQGNDAAPIDAGPIDAESTDASAGGATPSIDSGRRRALMSLGAGVAAVAAAGCTGAYAAAGAGPKAGAATSAAGTSATGTSIAGSQGRHRSLSGKTAIVTGARNNLGRGFAVALAGLGANVLVHQHRAATRAQAEETANMCREHGVKAEIYTADLSRVANVRKMYDEAFAAFGRVDIVVNNAGRIKKLPLAEISEEEFDRCNGINNKAMFFSMQEAAKRIGDGGRIINIGTSLLNATTSFYSVYAGTKAPMEEYTRMLAREIGHRDITVNVVAPGPVDTPFFHGQETPQSVNYIQNATPAKRLGKVSDIVPMVAFLATPEARWITGQTVWVNDGYSTR